MKVRHRKTGVVHEIGILAMVAAILSGKVRVGKAPGLRRDSIRGGKKFSRNKPCPCGSNMKFKRCCGATEQQKQTWEAAAARHRGDYNWDI